MYIHVAVQQFVWALYHLLKPLDADLASVKTRGIFVRGADIVQDVEDGGPLSPVERVDRPLAIGLDEVGALFARAVDRRPKAGGSPRARARKQLSHNLSNRVTF